MKKLLKRRPLAIALGLLTIAAAVAGFSLYLRLMRMKEVTRAEALTGGNASRGLVALDRYGCGACHTVEGLPNRSKGSAPPLSGIAERAFIAGVLENKPDNLVRWIVNPTAVDSLTAMPNVGVTEADARHIAAYLYSLE